MRFTPLPLKTHGRSGGGSSVYVVGRERVVCLYDVFVFDVA